MSSNCKIVKGISLFAIVWGILCVVLGVLMLTGSELVAGLSLPDGDDPVTTAQVAGVLYAALGVLYVIAGVLGARGANRPSKLKPFIYLAAAAVVIALANVGSTFAGVQNGLVWPDILTAVVAFTGIVYASRAMKEADAL